MEANKPNEQPTSNSPRHSGEQVSQGVYRSSFLNKELRGAEAKPKAQAATVKTKPKASFNGAPIAVVLAIIVTVAIAFFAFDSITYKASRMDKALNLIGEFKTAKALEILNKIKNKSNKDDPELDFLIIYAYSKSQQYDLISEKLEEITKLPKQRERLIMDFINTLSVNEKVDLLIKTIKKAKELNLDQDLFLTLSKERNSSNQEIQILETGLKLAKETDQIESYLLKRYIEVALMSRGNKKPQQAINYLKKAENLPSFKTSHYKDDVYLNIGLSYRDMKQYSQAWSFIKRSAQLGNTRAQDMMDQAQRNFVPIN